MSKSKFIREEQPAKLPTWELGIYTAVWVSILAYAYYSLARFTSENQELFTDGRLVDGWWFIGGKKDEHDFEMGFWKPWVAQSWPCFFGHVILGQICRYFSFETRQRLMVLYDVCAVAWLISPHAVAFWAVSMLAVAIVAHTTRSMKGVWLLLCLLIYMLQWEWKYPKSSYAIFLKWICYSDFTKIMLLRYSTFFGYLKMASFGHEIINSLESNDQTSAKMCAPNNDASENADYNNEQNRNILERNEGSKADTKVPDSGVAVLNVVQYMFYLPVVFTGPLFTFKDFNTQITAAILPWTKDRIRILVCDTVRVLAWGVVWELMLHYIYVYSIKYDESILEALTFWELAGEIALLVPFFYISYVVIYGLPGNIARLDQITPPYTPSCVHSTYRYAEDWRYFDRGLYEILTQHIYIPLGGSRRGPVRQLAASVLCFSFTCFWHGAMDFILAWTTFNLFIIGVEAIAVYVAGTPKCLEFEETHLSGPIVRRLSCLFWVPMRLLHTTATLIFIGGIKPMQVFARRIFVEGFPTVPICIFVAYYFFVQICMETHRRRQEQLKSAREKTD